MRISATVFVILISACIVNASVLDPVIENVVHLKASKPPSGVAGMWKKKTIWKPRWVKEWKSAKVMKPVWKKVWSPVQIREWVPIPKPPPGWDSISTPLASLHPKLQKAPVKDTAGHDSFTVHASTKIPLWDPIPYPESQQPPPPPPFSQPLHNADSSCNKGTCDNSHSGTFNHQQISEIIDSKYGAPEYFQNTEYSETVNHLTRLPPDGNNWRAPFPDSQTDNRFSLLPEFLVPPMFQPLPENNFRVQPNHNLQPFFSHIPVPREQISHSPAFEAQNGLRQWPPFPPEMKIKGHFITKGPDQPYKFQFPETERHAKNRTETTHGETFSNNKSKEKANSQTNNVNGDFRPQADGDIVQEAHLVGEYHYSEFDLPKLKHESKKPHPNVEEKDQVKLKPQQKVKAVPDVAKHKPTHHPLGESRQRQNQTEIEQETRQPQNIQHLQKKHIPDSPSNTSNANFIYQQQKAILKEILPSYTLPLIINETLASKNHRFAPPMNDNSNNHKKHLPVNLPSTLLLALEPESDFSSSGTNVSSLYQKENYPIYETPQTETKIPPNQRFSKPSNSVSNFNHLGTNSGIQRQKQYPVYESPRNPSIIPNNHRFSPQPIISGFNASSTNTTSSLHREENYPVYEMAEISTAIPPNHKLSLPLGTEFQDKPPRPNHYTTKLSPVTPKEVTKAGKPLFERSSSVQLVFPTTDEVPSEAVSKLNNYKLSGDALQKATTTEPYSVIFSSSLLSKTEAVTKSPVMIVTPIIQNES